MKRVHTPEMMDAPDAPRERLASALGFIRGVNRRLGGVRALVSHLSRWSANWPTDRPVTLLDIGTGSADLPVAARRWAMGRGFDLRVTGVDNHPTTLDLAREHVAAQGDDVARGVELVEADALSLTDRHSDRSFDYVHAGLFLHHMDSEIKVLTMLRIMDRLAARGIVWNDLMRSRIGLAAIRLMTIGQDEMVRHDAYVSVKAGFTKREALDLAHRVDLHYCRYSWNLFTHRFTLAGEKPQAWALP